MIQITNFETGEIINLKGKLLVAPNGVVFVKSGSKTIWCSGATNFEAKEI